jgi:hypothetical protein
MRRDSATIRILQQSLRRLCRCKPTGKKLSKHTALRAILAAKSHPLPVELGMPITRRSEPAALCLKYKKYYNFHVVQEVHMRRVVARNWGEGN